MVPKKTVICLRDCTDFASGKHREWIGKVVKSAKGQKGQMDMQKKGPS